MNDTIYRQDAIDAVNDCGICLQKIVDLPSAQQDDRLNKIAELVNGTINHFDREDAMDLLYQIKEVLK